MVDLQMDIWSMHYRLGNAINLWRCEKGKYLVIKAGKYRSILENHHNYILFHKNILPLFAGLEEQLTWYETTIQDRALNTINNDYVELEIFNEPQWCGLEDLEKENCGGLKIWKHWNCIFVSGDLKKKLEQSAIGRKLEFTEGFSGFIWFPEESAS